ncbi:protein disabled isoform X2 [Schistocerca gregaria]|nr:protein disabled isoform X2 [Schistocerca gregaria]
MAGADGEQRAAATPPPDASAASASAPAAAAPAEGSPRSAHRLSLRKSFRSLSAARTRSRPSHSHPPDKNEPSRFLGEGVSFKAKLIGILEVNEARGDRMCQEALADLKMAIRAAGEHKQRININIAIDGLRLRDEKTGDCLYHHPVHKISFIAQDMSDSRAFGYIFGSPDTGHRFFGIKTDKAASQVVIAMRDLFQVVFELKKKEIELAKQHIEQHQIKLGGGLFSEGSSGTKNGASSLEPGASKMRTIQEDSAVKENGTAASSKSAQQTSEVIADLLDLEFELNSIQQGIHQMERITPSDPFGPSSIREDPFGSDPFGDSFAPATTAAPTPKSSKQPIAILPPPPSAKEPVRSLADPFNVPATSRGTSRRSTNRAATSEQLPAPAPSTVKPVQTQAPTAQPEKHWFDQETESLFDEGELVTPPLTSSVNTVTLPPVQPLSEQDDKESRRSPSAQKAEKPFDVFTELDPLGTGRSKPYVDRKDFFQELKNPPKKVLKDLVTEIPSEATAPLFQATFEKGSNALTPGDGDLPCSTSTVLSSGDKTTVTFSPLTTSALTTMSAKKPLVLDVDPFEDTDPFDKTDPFAEDDFPQNNSFPTLGSSSDPFDTGFADFTMFAKPKKNEVFAGIAAPVPAQGDVKPSTLMSSAESTTPQTFHGPLRVSLPPEKTDVDTVLTTQSVTLPSSSTAPPSVLESPVDTLSKSKSKTPRLSKQTTLSTMVKLPSPKSTPRSSSRLVKQITVDSCTTSSTTQSVRLSPTPPMPPTPSKSDRKSPVSQGVLEGVTLRNRCAVTPSPPVVASFPDSGDGDSTSRLSGSSAELAEIAPEPPPRPAASIAAIKPPPLPPKRQQISCMMKPPPRPPHADEPPHYDYIENYETSTSPTPHEIDVLQSPPLPVPARRPKFPEVDFVPQRPRRQQPPQPLSAKSSIGSDDYLTPTPFPLLPPPQKKSPSTDSGKFHNLPKARSPVMTTIDSILMSTSSATTTSASDDRKKKPSTSLNITLSQLTKTGLQDLAAALGVSPGHLSNMTLQELTNCLSKLSTEAQGPENGGEETKTETDAIKRDKYATLRESVDDEPEFKADFETNFEPTDSSDKLEDVFQEAPFDKYAVFRELIEEAKDDRRTKGSTDSVDAEPKQRVVVSESSAEEMKARKEAEDKYAALREISLDEGAAEKEDGDTSSEKDDSIAEGIKPEEEDDLLTLSRQQSESTESPTVEAVTLREPQSIIETTILEEDATALEDDAGAGAEEIKHTSPLSAEISPVTKNADEQEAVESADGNNGSSVSEKEDATNDIGSPDKDDDRAEGVSSAEGWAKFDSIVPEKTSPDTQREEVSSPWSSDGKETGRMPPASYQDHLEREQEMERRRRMRARGQWRDDDEEEEGWEDRRADGMPWQERPWRENGWSDGEPYYDDGIHRKERMYHEERTARRRRPAPWKSGQRSSRDPSPWEQDDKDNEDHGWVTVNKRWRDRSVDEDEEEEEEEYEISRKPRSKQYPAPRDDERWRRYEHREMNGLEYEEGRKRRPSPWRGEGESRSSWESVSWDEEERFSQREYCDRRSKAEREEVYWRRRELEHDGRPYPWSRKCVPPDEDYMRPEQTLRWKGERYHRYSRDRSRELPWEDDYSEQGDEESPRYLGRKQNWPKRPSSATESRWTPEKGPASDYVPRIGEKQQHSLPSAARSDRPDSIEKMGSYTMTERRYREKVGRRPRSREGYFNSDQEYDYWPQQERPRRQDKEIGYDQRSQTLHTRRPQRYKKSSEYSYSQKSPFDDDFTMQPFEVGIDINKSQGAESDASDSAKQRSPALSSHSLPVTAGSSVETFAKGKESHTSDPNSRPKEIGLSSPPEPYQSSLGEDTNRVRTPRSSTHRKSPFEDDFTPTEIRGIRLASSVSSDISDHRKSPYEDTKPCSRGPSVVDEPACASVLDQKNGKLSDDVFLPAGTSETGKTHSEHAFADFESMPFGDGEFIPSPKTLSESKNSDKKAPGTVWSGEDSNKHDKFHPGMKLRMSNLMRADSSTSLKKSESINIFVRESDPFDDDFFCSDTASTIPRPRSENTGRAEEKSGASNQTEVFNWTQAFDSFNFEEEK